MQRNRSTNLVDLPPRDHAINRGENDNDYGDDVDLNDGDTNDFHLDRLRLKLRHFFMDPLQKWKKKNTRPWKLLVQILKIFIFTTQLVVFGSDMAKFITYKDEMQTTFKQLFLKDWDPSADAIAYPGPYVPYAVYTKPAFYQTINYSIKVYSNISDWSVGPYSYQQTNRSQDVAPVDICTTSYVQADYEPISSKYNYSMKIETYCDRIENYAEAGSTLWDEFDIRDHLSYKISFAQLISLNIKLPLRTLLLEDLASPGYAEIICFNVDVEILLDNSSKDGQIIINLKSEPRRTSCSGSLANNENDNSSLSILTGRQTLNSIVIIFCLLSFSLCFRSIFRAYKLINRTDRILNANGNRLEWSDKFEFLDSWLVLIIINDILIASATVIIIFYDERLLETSQYTICSLLIGVGNFLSWAGLLRYLSFFKNYNLLIITLRKSFPHVLRFMLCTMLIYCGFCFCGWIVFGPYHFKFRQLSTTTECLFSLINGDDMFETFALLRSEISSIWWFSRIYLYLFVSLFIYVVLSLFIALIMDAYEIIKQYSDNGFPKSRLQKFYLDGDLSQLAQNTHHPSSANDDRIVM